MSKLVKAIKKHEHLSLEKQKKAGEAIEGKMEKEHTNFLKNLIKLFDTKEIDTLKPDSFLKQDVYKKLKPEWKSKVDLVLVNIVDEARRIEDFYRSTETPNSSPHLQTMIEHLWQMKQRIEEKYDVFKI